MDLIPIPEIVAAFIGAVILAGIRFAWRAARARLGRRAETATRQGTGGGDAERLRARLVASCVLMLMISIPLILHLVPPNGMYGFRTGTTRSNPAIWYQANAFMGWALSTAAVASATLVMVLPSRARRWMVWAAFYGPLAGAIVLSFVYERLL